MALDEAVGRPVPPSPIPKTWEEALATGIPDNPTMRRMWEQARNAEAKVLKDISDALGGRRREPKPMKLSEVAHKLSVPERRARREKNKAKRQRASAGRTASLMASEKAVGRAKRITRMAKGVERKHPSVNARQTAKNMLKIEKELIGHIQTHIKSGA